MPTRSRGSSCLALLLAISAPWGCGPAGGDDGPPADADPDADGDGHGAATDCDDRDPEVHPEAEERCDGRDDDCDGDVDEGAIDAATWYADGDGDGHGGEPLPDAACDAPPDSAGTSGDCDDSDADVHPDAEEHCDGVDEDCDGAVDDGAADASVWYRDGDGDGFGDPADAVWACDAPDGRVEKATDCDDGVAGVHPGAAELCDAIDQDCDGAVDDGLDSDGDGLTPCAGDCDDSRPEVHPGADEACDGLDSDCDGATSVEESDADGDGVAPCEGDCDDARVDVLPSGEERCDGADQDCDGAVDEGAVDAASWYPDADGDGYGVTGGGVSACEAPDDMVGTAGDCDDADPTIHPGAPQTCDGVDRDCTGSAFDYPDTDGDGYTSCSGDCDDTRADVYPGAPEICEDWADNGCDGDDGACRLVGTIGLDESYARFAGDIRTGMQSHSITAAGDFDGDGIADLALGAPDAWGLASGLPEAGCVYIVRGPVAESITLLGAPTLCGDFEAGYFGFAVAPAGDLDADGRDDLLVGATGAVSESAWYAHGGVYLIRGREGEALERGPSDSVWIGEEITGTLGASVAMAGDVDGDGDPDVIAGAPTVDCGGYERGGAYLIPGPLDPGEFQISERSILLCGTQDGSLAGHAVAPAGDVDGDGFDDVWVGAPGYDDTDEDQGALYLVRGPIEAPMSLADSHAMLVGERTGEAAGEAIVGSTDFDGDGRIDVAVSAPQPTYIRESGTAMVVWGPFPPGRQPLGARATEIVHGASWLGLGLANAGDLDGDGLPDLAVTSPAEGLSHGRLFFFVSPLAPGTEPADARWTVSGVLYGPWVDGDVAVVGDVTADGLPDFLVGDRFQSPWDYRPARYSLYDGDGPVYLVPGPPSDLELEYASTIRIEQPDSREYAGSDVAFAGDLDGDGAQEVIVGARDGNYEGGSSGGAHIVGGPVPPGVHGLGTAHATFIGEGDFTDTGAAVAAAGDLDGDGFDDVVIGAPGGRDGGTGSGTAYLLRGPISGYVDLAAVGDRLVGEAGEHLGTSVAGIGDVNGDGYDDVAVGAPQSELGGEGAGAVYVVYGPATGWLGSLHADAILIGEAPGDLAGTAVAPAGDVDGDGTPDLWIGAPGRTGTLREQGAAYLFRGPLPGVSSLSSASARVVGDLEGLHLGLHIAPGRDVDGDGAPDLLVSGSPEGTEIAPTAFLLLAPFGGDLSTSTASLRIDLPQRSWQWRNPVALGDLDTDGQVDVVVGSPENEEVYVFYGPATGNRTDGDADLVLIWDIHTQEGHTGESVAAGRDVDGDGREDLLVGCPDFGGFFIPAGSVHVVRGSGI